jgi:hypothetical protein
MKATMLNSLNLIVESIINEEKSVLAELDLENYLSREVQDPEKLKQFAQIFYFVRYDFCRLNFILGERCGTNEFLWAGLARNLYEELGGKSGDSHNKLYQDFLASIGCDPEESLPRPEFTHQFNLTLENYCRNAPLSEALSAIAIYEIFDIPDYQVLLRVMKKAGVSQQGLRFFQVHAVANHFELFEDILPWLKEQEGGEAAFARAKDVVFQTQTQMWRGLMVHLQELSACPV